MLLAATLSLGWVLGWVSAGAGARKPESDGPIRDSIASVAPSDDEGSEAAHRVQARRTEAMPDRTAQDSQPLLEQRPQESTAGRLPDEGIASCLSALERLRSPTGRKVVDSTTDLDELLRDRRVNPAGLELDASERAELAAIAAEWDAKVEDARFLEMVEYWRGIDTALRSGRFLTRAVGQSWKPADFHADYGTDIVVTDISGPTAGVGEPRRIVIQNPASNLAMFQAISERNRLMNQRSQAFSGYFLDRQIARRK